MDIQKKLNQKLVMTLLARNEEDIIEECIKFHLSQGVDFIIATDNGSTDNTRNIFLKYQEMGVLHLIDEPEHNYQQSKWVNRMILLAKNKYEADWVINVDADEFWYSNYGNLKLALPDPKKSNVVFVGALQISAIDGEDFTFQMPEKVSGVVSGIFKCLHTTKGYKHNVMGNHDVKMKPFCRRATTTADIIIFHFQIRSYKHYEQKVVISAKALMNNPVVRAGNHILAHYELYKQGKLKEFYAQMTIGEVNHPCYFKDDSRLYTYIHNGYKSIDSILFKDYNIYSGKKVKYDALTSIKRIPERISKKIAKIKSKKSK